jgi:multidrug efflux pump subunit AcrB
MNGGKTLFSNFSVKRPFTVVVAVVIIAILGAVSFRNMSTDLLPSINLPYTVISTTYVGASPEEVEMMVTRPIEQAMASISNIKSVRSVSRENMSIVILEFTAATNMDSAVIEMRESLDLITSFMPSEIGSPIILKLNPDMMPVMVLSAAVKDTKISESSQYISNNVIPQLESVAGVASVSASGLVDNEIHIIIRDEKLEEVNERIQSAMFAAMTMPGLPSAGQGVPGQGPGAQMPEINITKDMVSGILKGQNFSMPAGYITEDGIDYLVRTGDKIKDIDELKNLPVMALPVPGMEPIVLEEVAEIIMMDNSADKYTKVNGNDAVILTIQKQTEFSTADVAKDIRARINSITDKDASIQLISLMDQGEYIDIVVNSITSNLIYGGILAILILLIFLRDLRPTLIVGFAIPVSLVTAFVMMYFSSITLNVISMGGLALGVGMLVDNSIVVIENIYRMRHEGKSAKEAAVEGARQVSGAITASTLTTVSVFVPILFTQGMTRQIFSDMGLTITYSLVASLIIALTLVPMMASNMMIKNITREHRRLDRVKDIYVKIINFSLNRKWLVIVITIALLAVSITGAFSFGTEFFPASDTGQLQITVTMPKGTVFTDTVAMADKVVEIIQTIEEVETVGATVSGGMFGMRGFGGSGGRTNSDSVSIYVLLNESKTKATGEIAQLIRDKTDDLNCEINVSDSSMDMTSMGGGSISIDIRGREFDTLESIAKDIAAIVAGVEGTVEVSDGLDKLSPEVRVVVDKEKSIANGLTVAQVYMEVTKLLKDESAATTLNLGAHVYDIIVQDEESTIDLTKDGLSELTITTPQDTEVALKDIASIEEASGFSRISRKNQQRFLTVSAELADGYNVGKVSTEINNILADYKVPEGYFIDTGGTSQMIRESFRDLYLMLILAVVFIYLIMVAQFQSLLSPFIVMFTIPLAFTGGFLGLMVSRKPVSVVAFVGLIVLSGVVVNNGIVFIDYINILRASGKSKREAIIEAGTTRLRPIIMTALTTIIALSTMSFGVGMGTEMMQPMAITAIGGLIYSTLLTLVIIPVLYDAFNRKDRKVEKEST